MGIEGIYVSHLRGILPTSSYSEAATHNSSAHHATAPHHAATVASVGSIVGVRSCAAVGSVSSLSRAAVRSVGAVRSRLSVWVIVAVRCTATIWSGVAIDSVWVCHSVALIICVRYCGSESNKSDCQNRDSDQLLLSFVHSFHLCNNCSDRVVNGLAETVVKQS